MVPNVALCFTEHYTLLQNATNIILPLDYQGTIQAGAVYSLLIGIRGLRAAGILRIARLALQ